MIVLVACLASIAVGLAVVGQTMARAGQLDRLLPRRELLLVKPENLAAAVLAAGIVVALLLRLTSGGLAATVAAAVAVASWAGLHWWPAAVRRRREQALLAGLPFVLDLLALAVGSGLGPVQAIEVVSGHLAHGPWREELALVRSELAVGRTFADALGNLERRYSIHAVRSFARSLQQALTLGSPLESFLRQAAREHRAMARERLASRINALPAVLSVVTMVFLMPVIIVIVVLPNVLDFLHAHW